MKKDEILAKSRKENQGTDEMEKYAIAKASAKAVAVGGLVCFLMFLFEAIFFKETSFNLWAVYLSITGTTLLVKYFYLRKKHELIFGLMEIALAAAFLVIYFVRMLG